MEFSNINEFMDYYGLIEIPEELEMTESVRSKIGELSRNHDDKNYIKKMWNTIESKFENRTISKFFDEKDTKNISKEYKNMMNTSDYSKYKKSFDKICKIFGLSGDICLNKLNIARDNEHKCYKCTITFQRGKKRIIIPNGMCLIYQSDNPNVNTANPKFKDGSNFFSSKRCYFKLHKEKPSFDNTKLTTKDTVQTAYIDPTTLAQGSVYLDTDKPIQLCRFAEKMKKIFKTESSLYEDGLDSKLYIYEQYRDGKIEDSDFAMYINTINEIDGLIKEASFEPIIEEKNTTDLEFIKKTWNNTSFRTIIPKCYFSTSVPDEVYFLLKDAFDGMVNAQSYSVYKKHFDTVTKLCHIPPDKCIIRKYVLKKGEEDKNYVRIEYANAQTKITIPAGYKLYHKTPVDIPGDVLEPQFKGRAKKGHLYNAPRLYFSIKKDMGKSHADIERKDKVYMWEVVENIKTAYVDPLVPFHITGAVFIETNHPIKVKRLDKIQKENMKVESYGDMFDFDSICNSMNINENISDDPLDFLLETENTLNMIDDDSIDELFLEKEGAINSIKNAIKSLINKIKEVIISFKDWVQSKFMSKEERNQYKLLKEQIKKDKELANTKIAMEQWEPYEKLYDDAMEEIDKEGNKENPNQQTIEDILNKLQNSLKELNENTGGAIPRALTNITLKTAVDMADRDAMCAKAINMALQSELISLEELEKILGEKQAEKYQKKVLKYAKNGIFHRAKVKLLYRKKATFQYVLNKQKKKLLSFTNIGKDGKVKKGKSIVSKASIAKGAAKNPKYTTDVLGGVKGIRKTVSAVRNSPDSKLDQITGIDGTAMKLVHNGPDELKDLKTFLKGKK